LQSNSCRGRVQLLSPILTEQREASRKRGYENTVGVLERGNDDQKERMLKEGIPKCNTRKFCVQGRYHKSYQITRIGDRSTTKLKFYAVGRKLLD